MFLFNISIKIIISILWNRKGPPLLVPESVAPKSRSRRSPAAVQPDERRREAEEVGNEEKPITTAANTNVAVILPSRAAMKFGNYRNTCGEMAWACREKSQSQSLTF